MITYKIQFWMRHRGYVDVQAYIGVNESAHFFAVRCVLIALDEFNRKWPGARREELICVGITDGQRTVNAKNIPA